MSWDQNRLWAARLATALVIGCTATAATADVLVVRATGPSAKSYPAGRSLADNARITLQANDSVVLLDSRGTRTLKGPGTFSPNGPAQASRRSAIAAVATGKSRRARVGAVRGTGDGEPRSPSLWYVDVAKPANVCLADPSHVTLWRADATKSVNLTVTRAGDGASRQVEWKAGDSTLGWPTDLAVREGDAYRLSWPGATAPTAVTFRTLASEPANPEAMATALIEKGCTAQLDLLIATLEEPGEPASTGS